MVIKRNKKDISSAPNTVKRFPRNTLWILLASIGFISADIQPLYAVAGDKDNDGIGDIADLDDDNDGILDSDERVVFTLDSNGVQVSSDTYNANGTATTPSVAPPYTITGANLYANFDGGTFGFEAVPADDGNAATTEMVSPPINPYPGAETRIRPRRSLIQCMDAKDDSLPQTRTPQLSRPYPTLSPVSPLVVFTNIHFGRLIPSQEHRMRLVSLWGHLVVH